MAKPMLALPMGKDDWENGRRWRFLQICQPVLERLGWCIGIEAKGGSLDGWARECFLAIKKMGGRITLHPPAGIAKGMGDPANPIPEKLLALAKQVSEFIPLGLEAVTIHCAPAVLIDPSEDAGLERYNSPIGADEMLTHIQAQVEPLKQLNELMGGILHIENVDIIDFRGGGYRVPTYLALQTGCWKDLVWLKEQAGIQGTFDSEHFFCASNLLVVSQRENQADFRPLTVLISSRLKGEEEFSELAGYRLAKGWPPKAIQEANLEDYVEDLEPSLFHLGGATDAVDENGRIATHQPSFDNPQAKKALDFELQRTMTHPEVIGCVVEVTGQFQPEKYSEWSPRVADDEEAKRQTYLAVVNEIEAMQKGG